MKLRIDISTREERVAYLAEALDGLFSGPPEPAPTLGGRRAAIERLRNVDLRDYNRSRNFLNRRGVSALSMYIRHGVLGLAEVRDYVLNRFGQNTDTAKFVNELAWRAFWQLVYADLGERIHQDVEQPKHSRYRARGLPADVAAAETGAFCIDESLRQLFNTGYIHNHARMWIAAYLQHWRSVDWRDGAQLFYRHLLDGDPASNSLSWQWVGSTFSHKPYFFNRQNVERFSDGELCARCPLASGGCPFDDSYENLAQRLFGVPLEALENGPRRT
jgi:deoxyribodipyrimidine photo-lyase